MTKIHVLSHTLTSVASDVINNLSSSNMDVVLTNVSYHDDSEMARTIARKKSEYQSQARFHTTPHGLADFIINFESSDTTVVIDNLNLFVSNLMLLYNSEYLTLEAIRIEIFRELERVVQFRRHLGFNTLIILTSEIDFDFTVRTHLGRLYQQLLYDVNAFIARFLADTYSLLTHGTTIPLSPRRLS